jgi:hypothetical protein
MSGLYACVAGVMVSIVAFQAVDPGSIPGPRIHVFDEASPPFLLTGLLSLVVEHSLCKRKVGGSIPPVGFFCSSWLCPRQKNCSFTAW